jgi:hypothetical protein
MRRPALLLGLWLVACAAASCAADNDLSGSLSSVFPLEVSRTEIAANTEALQITYVYNHGVFVDVVARVSVAIADVTLKPGVKIDLVGQLDGGVERCTVSHAPGGEPVRALPPIRSGDLTLDEGGTPGSLTRGSFSMLFETEGGDLGAGRDLTGHFHGLATDAGFGELP